MGNLLRKIIRNTNRIIRRQVDNSPDFESSAARVTGGKPFKRKKKKCKRFDKLEIKLRKGRAKSFKRHLEKTHPSTRGMIEIE